MSGSETILYGSVIAAFSQPSSNRRYIPIDPCNGGGQLRAAPDEAYARRDLAQCSESAVRITLCDQALWNQFNSIGTEMVLNKVGRRIFPSFRVTFSGLEPCARYKIMMDVERVDENRYKFQDGRWIVAGRADLPYNQQVFVHPLSSSTGEDIMNKVVSFHKVKLTNSPLKLQNGKFLLHSLHRYQLRVYIARCDSLEDIFSFSFVETNFITVTAYQNSQLSQLKIATNPYSKGFLPGGTRRRVKQSRKHEECDLPGPKRSRTECTPIRSQRKQDDAQMMNSASAPISNIGHYVENCDRHQWHQFNEVYYANHIPGCGPAASACPIYPPPYDCDGIHRHSLIQSNTRGSYNYEHREEYLPHDEQLVNNGCAADQWYNNHVPLAGQVITDHYCIGNDLPVCGSLDAPRRHVV